MRNGSNSSKRLFIHVGNFFKVSNNHFAGSKPFILALRQKESAPIIATLGEWITERLKTTLPNTALYKALTHAQDRWPHIQVYLTAGDIPIDNNYIERTIRPIAIGRKNWLFFGSLNAGEMMTGMMSFLATAKINGLDPAKWLLDTLKKLPTWMNSRLDELLPLRNS